jgi:CubicO group peptidase (beta-lactamase class C family)
VNPPPKSPLTHTPAAIAASTLNQRSRFAAAYSVLETAISNRAFPGASFGVLSSGQILALDGVGRFTYAPGSSPVQPGTIFDLASITKVMATTAAAMLLYERGALDLDLPLGDILPAFVIGAPCAEMPRERCGVTLRMLFAHSSGLPAYARLFETNPTSSALLRACLQMPLEAPPGSRAEYSDIGFILLGKAIEVIAQEPLDNFCEREIFAPLGMGSTRYRPPSSWRGLIPPTEDDTTFRGRVIQGEVQDENCFVLNGVSGHAGVFSSAIDVLQYARSLFAQPGRNGETGLAHPGTIDLFATRQPPAGSSRALGWDTPSGESSSGHHFSRRSIGHLGYTGASLWIDLDRQLAVTLLTNRTWPDRSSQAIRQVRPAFHDAIFEGISD